MFVIGFLDCFDVALAVSMFTIWMGFLAFCRNGSVINPLDFAAGWVLISNIGGLIFTPKRVRLPRSLEILAMPLPGSLLTEYFCHSMNFHL